MAARAFISGCEGLTVSADERAFLREADPWAVILFGRNVRDREQVRALTGELREALGRDAPILIDQEGGRVQRFKPPQWRAYPALASYGEVFGRDPQAATEATRTAHQLMALELSAAGVDVACAPVLDVPVDEADPVIGDRAFSRDPYAVATLGRAALEGLAEGGVLGVIKHIPGHGRATADSHIALPMVETSRAQLEVTDFAPFRALAFAPMAMTAHVLYTAIDDQYPATTSKTMIDEVIRGAIGFDGLLMCDDLSMQALEGDLAARTRNALAAGCDVVMHGNGMLHGERLKDGKALRQELEIVAGHSPELANDALRRADAVIAARPKANQLDESMALAQLRELLALEHGSQHV